MYTVISVNHSSVKFFQKGRKLNHMLKGKHSPYSPPWSTQHSKLLFAVQFLQEQWKASDPGKGPLDPRCQTGGMCGETGQLGVNLRPHYVGSRSGHFHREPGEGPWAMLWGPPATGPAVAQGARQGMVHPPGVSTSSKVCLPGDSS